MKHAQKSAAALTLGLSLMFGGAAQARDLEQVDTIGAWRINCYTDVKNDCYAFSGGKAGDSNFVMMIVRPEGDKGLKVSTTIPRSEALAKDPKWISLGLNGKQHGLMPVKSCSEAWGTCTSEVIMAEDEAEKLLSAKNVIVDYKTSEEEGIALVVPNTGLRNAVNRLRLGQ